MLRNLFQKTRWLTYGLVLAATIATLYAQEAAQFNRGIVVTQGNLLVSRGYVLSGSTITRDFRTATAESTIGAATYTAAELLSGYILRTPSLAATDVMPTAANLAAAIPGVAAGQSFFTVLDMGATPNGAVTLNGASTGVTYGSGCSTAIGTSDVMLLLINFTSATAYRVACLNVNT